MSKIGSSTTKFEVKKFNDKKISAYSKRGLKALLVQQCLHKTLQGKSSKPACMSEEDCEEMDLKAASMIQLCLVDEVMYNMMMKKGL